MFRHLRISLLLMAGLLFGCSGSSEPAETPEPAPTSGGSTVVYSIPSGWVQEDPSSRMRQGQYRLGRAEGDPEDGELAVFHFPGQGGSIQANVDRWVGQFSKADGTPAGDSAQTNTIVVNGSEVTLVDVEGTYKGGMGPMSSAPEKPDFRMLAAIIDTNQGPWFFKLTGPKATIAKWEASFQEFTQSLRVE